MHPYGIAGGWRQVAYVGVLGCAAALASLAALALAWWAVLPAFVAAYLPLFRLHEHLLWRSWRHWHGVPDLAGTWQGADGDTIALRQTWTRLALRGRLDGEDVVSRMAAWEDGALQVVLGPAVWRLEVDGAGLACRRLDGPAHATPRRLRRG